MSIRQVPNWLVWAVKSEPKSALTGERKRWQQNLTTYVEAAEFCKQNPDHKLGFMFTKDCGYFGLDLDGCRNPEDGGIEGWAAPFLKFPAWQNVSVSGTGVKLIMRTDEMLQRGLKLFDDVTGFGDHDPQVELFTTKYFALTVAELPYFDEEELLPLELERLSDLMGFKVIAGEIEVAEQEAGEVKPDELRDLLETLDVGNYSTRDEWLKILQAAHHATGGSDEGLEVFKDWSKGDLSKYDEGDTERDWHSQSTDVSRPITIATIINEIPEEDRPKPKDVPVEHDFEVLPKALATKTVDPDFDFTFNNNRNELFIAKKFVNRHNDKLRYVAAWKKWVYWDGMRWCLDPADNSVIRMVSDFNRELFKHLPENPKEAKTVSDFLNSLCNAGRIANIAKLVRARPEVYIDHNKLDSDLNLFNVQNATIDLRNGTIREHNPDDLLTLVADVEYVEGARCETWVKVLNDIFAGDGDLIRYVQKLLGYCMSGENSQEIFPVAYGDGCNGKSTITSLIFDLFGDYSAAVPSELFDSKRELHPTYIAQLFGRRFAAVAELEADVVLSEATVKKVTSNDKIEARRMREDPWSFTPSHTSWLSTNHKPRVKGVDKGIWRRIKLIPFNVDLTDVKDPSVPSKLAQEKSGVLNWLLEGYKLYQAEGFENEPDAVKFATEDYQDSEDGFKEFIEDKMVKGPKFVIHKREAFDAYVAWGGRLGFRNFAMQMDRLGFKHGKCKSRDEFRDQRVFFNIKLRD